MLNILSIAYLHDKLKLSPNYTKLKTMNERLYFLVGTIIMYVILYSLLLYPIVVSIIEIKHDMKKVDSKKENICKEDTTTFSVIQNNTSVVGHKVKPLRECGPNNVVVKTWPTGNKSAYCE